MPSNAPSELKRYLTKGGTHPSDEGLRVIRDAVEKRFALPRARKSLVIELMRYLWDQCGGNNAELSRRTGLTPASCTRILAMAGTDDPDLVEIRREHNRGLEEIRFQGRKQMIEKLWDLGEKLLSESAERYHDMKPRELVSAMKDVISQAQLLSGEATSRIARSDEKFMTEEELQKAIADLERRHERAVDDIGVQ